MSKLLTLLLTTLLITTSSTYAGRSTNPAYNPDGGLKDYGRHLPEPSMFQRKGWQPKPSFLNTGLQLFSSPMEFFAEILGWN
jgi:hypothetical protein